MINTETRKPFEVGEQAEAYRLFLRMAEMRFRGYNYGRYVGDGDFFIQALWEHEWSLNSGPIELDRGSLVDLMQKYRFSITERF